MRDADPRRTRRRRSSRPLERHERERERVPCIGWMRAPLDLTPVFRIERRKVRVTRGLGVHLGEIDAIGARQEVLENARTAEHDDLGDVAGERERLVGRARDETAIAAKRRIAGQDDAHAIREGPPDRVEGAPPHDQRLADGELAHASHVVGEPPGKPSVLADDPAAVARHDECDAAQTAIFALIGGWNWYFSSFAKPSRRGPGASPRLARATISR